jgi:hypothetical protein
LHRYWWRSHLPRSAKPKFSNNSEPGRFNGSYTTTDEIADDVFFDGTQHVGSFSFRYSNTNSGPVSATARFYTVNSTGGVGSLVATVPIPNLPSGSFETTAVNLQAGQQFDWIASPHVRNSSGSGGYVSIQFNAPNCGWVESEGPYSLNSFYDLTNGQLVIFQESNASFFLQIANSNRFPPLAVNFYDASIFGSEFNTGTVTIYPAPTSDITAELVSSNPAVAQVHPTLTLFAGATVTTFTIKTKAVKVDTPVSIKVQAGTASKIGTFTVTAQ